MKKVALINPKGGKRFTVFEPLNIGFIASYLEKHGVEVSLIDESAGQNLEYELRRYKPDIVGITALTFLAPRAYKIARMCKDMGILTVMGGVHASVLPEEALQHVDVVVKGEGEVAMLDIIENNIRSGVVTRPYIQDLDESPFPARHLMQMDFYLTSRDRLLQHIISYVPPGMKSATMLTSKGCPYSCTFCHNSWRGIPFRFSSPERVLEEMKELVEKYRIGALFFAEDNFFVNKLRAKRICQLIIDEGLNLIWGANSRVDNLNEDVLRIAKKAGCKQITFGFESGSQRILDILNKGTTVEQNRAAIELCHKVGISAQGSVMIGNPTETLDDIKATQRFLEEIKLEDVGIVITTPYPGTALWKQCEEHNLIPTGVKWEDFDTNNVVIPVCETILPKEIERLQVEMNAMMAMRNPMRLLGLVERGLVTPRHLIELLRNPQLAFSLFKALWRWITRRVLL